MLNLMQKLYCQRCDILFIQSMRKDILVEKFGNDIGGLIGSYLATYCLHDLIVELQTTWELEETNS